jgi:hypothetical protein
MTGISGLKTFYITKSISVFIWVMRSVVVVDMTYDGVNRYWVCHIKKF